MAQTSRGRRLMGEINVVPYIDVMLVLLIIFMITAPLLTQGVKVDLPKAGAEPLEAQRLQPLVLSVDREGRLYLNIGGGPPAAPREDTGGGRAPPAPRPHPGGQGVGEGASAGGPGRGGQGAGIFPRARARQLRLLTDPPPGRA